MSRKLVGKEIINLDCPLSMGSPFDVVKEYRKTAEEHHLSARKKSKVGLACPECGEPVIRGTGTVQQTVHWDGSVIRRRVCSQGHHFESSERVTHGKYKEFSEGWRQENRERLTEYNAKYRKDKLGFKPRKQA